MRSSLSRPGSSPSKSQGARIGDEVLLRLGGAKWAEQDVGSARTPGRSVDGELVFGKRLDLVVTRAEGEVAISVDAPNPLPPTMQRAEETATATPRPRGVDRLRSSFDGMGAGVQIYSSPAFAKRMRLSGDSFMDDPFLDDVTIEQPRKKLRMSFGSVGQWRYASRTPSPTKDVPTENIEIAVKQQAAISQSCEEDVVMGGDMDMMGDLQRLAGPQMLDGTYEREDAEPASLIKDAPPPDIATPTLEAATPPKPQHRSKSKKRGAQQEATQLPLYMPPPSLPRLRMPMTQDLSAQDHELSDHSPNRPGSPTTPKLRAVQNSALPLPSPFPTEAAEAARQPFGQIEHAPTLDAVNNYGKNKQRILEVGGEAEDKSLKPMVKVMGKTLQGEAPRNEPLRNDEPSLDNGVQRLVTQSDKLRRGPASKPEANPADDSEDRTWQPLPIPRLRTPTKVPPSEFSLDGIATAAPQSRATPQSQRDQAMAQTLKSLFGFGASPAPQLQTPAQPDMATPTPMFGLSEMDRARFGTPVSTKQQRRIEAEEPGIAETQHATRLEHEMALSDADELVEAAANSTEAHAASGVADMTAHVVEDVPLRRPLPPNFSAETPRISGEMQLPHIPAQPLHAQRGSYYDDVDDDDSDGMVVNARKASFEPQKAPRSTSVPAQLPEYKPPRGSAVTVIELDARSDAEESEPQSQSEKFAADTSVKAEHLVRATNTNDAATLNDVEDEVGLSSPLATSELELFEENHDAGVEAGLSSPLATSQLDQLEDEIMQDVVDQCSPTEAKSDLSHYPQYALSSSPAPRVTQPSTYEPPRRELVPGGPLAFFPEERIIEDSYDEFSATISTQPTPTADEEQEVITIADRELRRQSASTSIDGLPLQAEDGVYDMDPTPTAPSVLDAGERNVLQPSTARTVVIDLGSSSPVGNSATSPAAADSTPPAPVTQILADEMNYEQLDADETIEGDLWPPADALDKPMGSSEASDPTSPAPVTQTRIEDAIYEQPNAESHMDFGWSSPPDKEVRLSPEATELVQPALAVHSSVGEMLIEQSEDDNVAQTGFFQDLVDTEMLGNPTQEHRPVLADDERGPIAEADEIVLFETQFAMDITSHQVQEVYIDGSEVAASEVSESEVASSETSQRESQVDAAANSPMSFDTQLAAENKQMRDQSQSHTVSDSAHAASCAAEDSAPFETQIAVRAFLDQERTPQPSIANVGDSVSYPILPPSPLTSQVHQGLDVSESAAQLHSETLTSALPPTPQLTQAEPDSGGMESQAVLDISLTGQQSHERNNNRLITGHPDLQQEPAVSPARNIRSRREGHEAPPAIQDDMSMMHPSSQEQANARALPLEQTPMSSMVRKNNARKSLTARLSNVPDVISTWFSPKPSSGVSEREPEEKLLVNGHVVKPIPQSVVSDPGSNGFTTPMGYFTPLARLDGQLNPSSQQPYGKRSIDVLAVVTNKTKAPERARIGPKDYFTCFHIADGSLSAGSDAMVEVFRPWKATLPIAEVGDVVLLRAFAVKSRDREPYLLSTDASAWCVWRFVDAEVAGDNEGRPAWARKRSSSMSAGVREEAKGPPVELGDEERQHARTLRQWWITLHPAADLVQ
ncbi:hypothetical protein LTR08_007151 [Meristemomyces frigidus]|nr:hypothetical protein LTR08_007151 [Meristemomyces frigidus]